MRCRRCQRAISGIGKPAVAPVIPAAIAFAGGIGGLWSLTLGQDPSNALPHWSPVGGWGLGLGSLALASVLAWIGLVRRRCPECGSAQMLDAMEEESVIASELLAAEKAARAEAHAELAGTPREADRLAARDMELRATIERELRVTLGNELKGESEKSRAQMQKEIRLQLEQEVRREVEQRVRAEHEQRSAERERLLHDKMELGRTPLPSAPAQFKDVPSTRAPAMARATPSPPGTTARTFAVASAPQAVAAATIPRAAAPAVAKEGTTSPQRPALARSGGPASIPPAEVKTTTPATSVVARTAEPAVSNAKVDTAPLSLMPQSARATTASKTSVAAVQVPLPKSAAAVLAPASTPPASGKDSGSSGPKNQGT